MMSAGTVRATIKSSKSNCRKRLYQRQHLYMQRTTACVLPESRVGWVGNSLFYLYKGKKYADRGRLDEQVLTGELLYNNEGCRSKPKLRCQRLLLVVTNENRQQRQMGCRWKLLQPEEKQDEAGTENSKRSLCCRPGLKKHHQRGTGQMSRKQGQHMEKEDQHTSKTGQTRRQY